MATLLQRIVQSEMTVTTGNYYEGLLAFQVLDGEISKVTWNIVRNMEHESKLAGILLAFSLNRWEEMYTTNWKTWADGEDQEVYQPKTRTTKILKGAPPVQTPHDSHPDPTPHWQFPSYRTVANAIRQASPHYIQQHLSSCNSFTHIFRHIETSFHASQNVPKNILRKKLGHRSDDAIVAYLHDFALFQPDV